MYVPGKPGQCCHGTPGKEYASQPDSRADSVKQQIAWNFEQEIPNKEYSEDQAELPARYPQVLVHRQRSDADVGAIEITDDVQQEEEGKELKAELSNRPRFNRRSDGAAFDHDHLSARSILRAHVDGHDE